MTPPEWPYTGFLFRCSPTPQGRFGFTEIQVVSFSDLYASKLVAVLDRQHPRDLFDVRDLLANKGIDDWLRKAFIVYILSHNRPIVEVPAPTRQDIAQEFERGFEGMTEKPVRLEDLLQVREDLIVEIDGKMPDEHRRLWNYGLATRIGWSAIQK